MTKTKIEDRNKQNSYQYNQLKNLDTHQSYAAGFVLPGKTKKVFHPYTRRGFFTRILDNPIL